MSHKVLNGDLKMGVVASKQPKYKNEIREAIIANVIKNKNAHTLKHLLTVSDVLYRKYDDKLYNTVSDRESDIASIICDIMGHSDKRVHSIRLVSQQLYFRDLKKGSTNI